MNAAASVILTAGETPLEGTRAGGKAVGLAKLRAAGFPVPAWFAIAADASDADVDAARSEIDAAVGAMQGDRFAVRSSAADEDGATHSFAGQLETFLDVAPGDVAARIMDVRRSALSERVAAYRRSRGLPPQASAGVIVQEMIAPDAAGVAFSRDPVTGDDCIVISAVHGLGEQLVSGDANGDTLRIAPDGELLARDGEPVLELAAARNIARVARAVEAAFGAPQDIEWALAGATLHLLQARPITTLAQTATIWDNSNIAESYGGVNSTLTFSFARYAYAKAYRRLLHVLQVSPRTIDEHDDALENLLGLVEGRMYYNLVNWYRLLALLPGFRFNRTFMERMMGLDEGLPPEALGSLTPRRFEKIADFAAMLRMGFALVREYLLLPKRIVAFHRWFDETLARGTDLSTASNAEVIAEFRQIEDRLAHRWDTPLVNDFMTMIFFGTLCGLCKRWCGDADGTLQNALVSECGGMVSAEPAVLIVEMGRIALAHPEIVALLARGDAQAGSLGLAGAPDLERLVKAYVARFGDRCESELKLESVTLGMNPLPLYRAIARAAQAGERASSGTHARDFARAAEGRASAALRVRPLRRAVFAWVLRNARDRIRDRENLRFERTRLFGRIREIFRELGSRAQRAGILEHADDVFHLEIDEALGVLDIVAVDAIRSTIAQRRSEALRHAAMPSPPHRVVMENGRILTAEPSLVAAKGDDARRGLGCCAGIVRGIVRVVSDPAASFEQGEILVTERTDPSWVMLFPAAGGILVERGSLLSHAAIVSREMGIPSIVAVDGLTTWLRTGDVVEFDGASGLIRRVAAP
ncbi:MAG: pyruvate phosphate dikinase PEP/pyruvate-binding protein [Candidatus Eremiobacteraeota bacterium]|nr:pyruvate phosphate dikinase PEP/pyruvate-binding protein [Candidatus Eremiobacteraeota bacterium]